MLIFQVPEETAQYHNIPYTVVINPIIEPIGDEMVSAYEGCLSVPELVGLVPRYKHVRYSYQTVTGASITVTATDWHARVIQHEADHLVGTLFIQRMQDLQQLYYEHEFAQFVARPKKNSNHQDNSGTLSIS